MAVLIFIMALLVIFPGIWQGHHGNNGPAILLELALLCDYGHTLAKLIEYLFHPYLLGLSIVISPLVALLIPLGLRC